MQHLGSDSEIEEIVAPTPRSVRRPVPVRAKTRSSDDGSDDSDDDFFRLSLPAAAAAAGRNAEESSQNAGSSPTAGAGRNAEAGAVAADAAERISDSGSGSGSDSDSDSDDGTGEKRRYSRDGGSGGEKRARSRSVSLTPPPSSPGIRAGPGPEPGPEPEPARYVESGWDGCCVVDSDSDSGDQRGRRRRRTDLSGLDPALQAAILAKRPGGSGSGSGSGSGAAEKALEKVQVEFQFVFDDEFLSCELPAVWEARRWGRTRIHHREKVARKLGEHVAVIIFTTDTVGNALRAYADAFAVNVLATDPVLMNRTMRVFPTSTVASLGDRLAHYISVYPRSVYNRVRERERVARAQLAREQEQAQRELEMVRELQRSAHMAADDYGDGDGDGDGDGNGDDGDNGGDDGAPPAGIRIKIRDRAGKDTLLLVAASTPIRAVIENYRKLSGLGDGVQIALEFDDEKLDPDATIGDTEIEDDDMLTSFCQ
ncbi:hypothetical protein H4R18_003890 [Coemansia javaensis]|uniref:Rad60/SUMO-like domain-containing protein n=1 Tax=Coemansia javaensis TaxID=2761396 RepID=A0A9W8LFN6_9FUNG|nr:hypothetical protein H4R18_003890 [Coemansia javaensis]